VSSLSPELWELFIAQEGRCEECRRPRSIFYMRQRTIDGRVVLVCVECIPEGKTDG